MSIDEQQQQLEEQLQRLLRTQKIHRVELYRRASIALRVRRVAGAPTTETRAGSETGTALRGQHEPGGPVSFSAASGASDGVLSWIAEHASRTMSGRATDAIDWTPTEPVESHDLDPESRLPSPAEMNAWLESASERLITGRSLKLVESWVEVATTIESWATSDGLRASRSRTRAWALARCRTDPASPPLDKPLLIASRSWQELSEATWKELLEDRAVVTPREAEIPQARLPVLFNPESSATLVSALVGLLNADGANCGLKVGPGWRIQDEPRETSALFGGSFDDAGFKTSTRLLADGRNVVDGLRGAGHYRRPSFRNRPVAVASHLVSTPEKVSLPRQILLVSELSVHAPVEGGLMLAVQGALLRDGEPVGAVRRGIVRGEAADWVQRCVGGIGPARGSYRGVVTPALLFTDLDVRTGSAP